MALTVAMAFGVTLAALVFFVLARKANRDVVEGRSADRREEIAAGLAGGDWLPLAEAMAGGRGPQEDAIVVLRADPEAVPSGSSGPKRRATTSPRSSPTRTRTSAWLRRRRSSRSAARPPPGR